MASFGSISTPAPANTSVAIATNYFVSINELSARTTASTQEEVVQPTPSMISQSLEPFFPYTPFILTAVLFIAAFGILIVNRTKSLKNLTTALLLALMTASIPTVISYIGTGSRQAVNAGPDEIPREVRVTPDTPSFVIISWKTDAKHTGVVRFGAAPLSNQTARVYIANDRTEVTDHSIRIGGLTKGKTYEFEILSGTTWYDNGGTYIQFTQK